MPTTPRSQSALAADQNFQKRLSSLLVSEAIVIAGEDPTTEHHANRRSLAQQVLTNPTQTTAMLAPTICNGTNLVAAETSYNFEGGAVETAATDAEIRSQISTLWNVMAGV